MEGGKEEEIYLAPAPSFRRCPGGVYGSRVHIILSTKGEYAFNFMPLYLYRSSSLFSGLAERYYTSIPHCLILLQGLYYLDGVFEDEIFFSDMESSLTCQSNGNLFGPDSDLFQK
jgi:hypothetical protein